MNDRIHTVIGVLPPMPQYPARTTSTCRRSSCPFRMSPFTLNSRTRPDAAPVRPAGPGRRRWPRAQIRAGGHRIHASPEYPGRLSRRPGLHHRGDVAARRADQGGPAHPAAADRHHGVRAPHRLRQHRQPHARAAGSGARARWRCAPRSAPTGRDSSASCSPRAGCSRSRAACSASALAAATMRLLTAFAARFTPRADEIALDGDGAGVHPRGLRPDRARLRRAAGAAVPGEPGGRAQGRRRGGERRRLAPAPRRARGGPGRGLGGAARRRRADAAEPARAAVA